MSKWLSPDINMQLGVWLPGSLKVRVLAPVPLHKADQRSHSLNPMACPHHWDETLEAATAFHRPQHSLPQPAGPARARAMAHKAQCAHRLGYRCWHALLTPALGTSVSERPREREREGGREAYRKSKKKQKNGAEQREREVE